MARTSKRRTYLIRAGAIVAYLTAAVLILGASGARAVNPDAMCNGVFPGVTPDWIQKTASAPSVEIGSSITFTVTWTATGANEAVVRDCFRIDDGSDETLNALVAGLSEIKTVANAPNKETGSTTFTITVPDIEALAGHQLVDRAKCTKGCRESKSNIVSVSILGHPEVVEPSPSPTVLGKTVTRGGSLARTGAPISTGLFLVGGLFLLLGAGLTRAGRPRTD